MANTKKITQSLKKHEGFKKEVYTCTAGVATIGYGFALKDLNATERAIWGKELRLTQDEVEGLIKSEVWHLLYMNEATAEEILEVKVKATLKAVFSAWQWLAYRDSDLQDAFVEWVYQLGLKGVFGFVKSLELIENYDYLCASEEVLNSRWAKQTPKRAKALSKVLKECAARRQNVKSEFDKGKFDCHGARCTPRNDANDKAGNDAGKGEVYNGEGFVKALNSITARCE